jgi:hypothetical protein
MDDAEAAELAAAIRMSLEPANNTQHSAAMSDSAPSATSVDIPVIFHFVTECFFLALQGLHVGIVPFLQDNQLLLHDLQRFGFADVMFLFALTPAHRYMQDLPVDKHSSDARLGWLLNQMEALKVSFFLYVVWLQWLNTSAQAMLAADQLMQRLAKFYGLFSAWLMHLSSEPNAKIIFSWLPEFVFFLFIKFLCQRIYIQSDICSKTWVL